jgi:hypothetical protein
MAPHLIWCLFPLVKALAFALLLLRVRTAKSAPKSLAWCLLTQLAT